MRTMGTTNIPAFEFFLLLQKQSPANTLSPPSGPTPHSHPGWPGGRLRALEDDSPQGVASHAPRASWPTGLANGQEGAGLNSEHDPRQHTVTRLKYYRWTFHWQRVPLPYLGRRIY
jgi:hypothetical protein